MSHLRPRMLEELQRRNYAETTMSRPAVEVADVFRSVATRLFQTRRPSFQQLKVVRAITRCRTAALGGHLDACSGMREAVGPIVQLL